jgi:uridine phosphorylase
MKATLPRTKNGRMYHIGLTKSQLADYILLCGEPERAEKIAKHFDKIITSVKNREFYTVTGKYKDIDVSVMGTGIGPDNTEIAVVEISEIVNMPTFIRVGSCGALQRDIKLGDLIISTGAVRLENTTSFFVPQGYPALANYEVVLALIKSAENNKVRYHCGITASAPGFYGAQSRKTAKFHPRFPNLPWKLSRLGVLNFEMETSTLFILSSIAGFRSGAVCAVYANRPLNRFVVGKEKYTAEKSCIEVSLSALEFLDKVDREKRKRNKKFWYPEDF